MSAPHARSGGRASRPHQTFRKRSRASHRSRLHAITWQHVPRLIVEHRAQIRDDSLHMRSRDAIGRLPESLSSAWLWHEYSSPSARAHTSHRMQHAHLTVSRRRRSHCESRLRRLGARALWQARVEVPTRLHRLMRSPAHGHNAAYGTVFTLTHLLALAHAHKHTRPHEPTRTSTSTHR